MARNKYDIDEVIEDKFDFGQLKRVFQYVKPYRGQLAFALFLMLSASALTMLFPMFISEIMDTYIPAGNIRAIVTITLISLVIVLYTCVCIRLKIRITSRIGQAIVHQRSDIFCHLQELPFSYYDDRPHGKIQVRVVNYVNSLSDLLSNGIINTITDMCNLIFILIFMLLLHVRLTLICLCGLPVLFAVIVFVKRRQRRAWQIQSNKQSNLTAYIAESINGLQVQLHHVALHRLDLDRHDGVHLRDRDRLDLGRDLRCDSRHPDRFHLLHLKILGADQHARLVLQFAAHRHRLLRAHL